MQDVAGLLLVLTFYSIFKSSGSINCHKCYRLEECTLKNCSSLYTLLDTTYREHFFIDHKQILPICPHEEDVSSWEKLEVDGQCSGKGQPCAVGHFSIAGMTLRSTKLHGVFLGCPQPSLAMPLVPKNYRCVTQRSSSEAYFNGIVHPRYKYKEFTLTLTLCHYNCTENPWKCDLCFENGCVYSNNTKIAGEKASSIPVSMTWILFGASILIVIVFLMASFCGMQRVGRLDLIMTEDGTIIPYKN